MNIFFTNAPKSYGKYGEQWKAKWVNKNTEFESLQLRKTFGSDGNQGNGGNSVFIIVGLKGWKYKDREFNDTKNAKLNPYFNVNTSNLNVRLGMNGSFMGTWELFEEFQAVINEAKDLLEMDNEDKTRDTYIAVAYEGKDI